MMLVASLVGLVAVVLALWVWFRFEDRKQRAEAIRRYGPIESFDAKSARFRPYGFPGPAGLPPHPMP